MHVDSLNLQIGFICKLKSQKSVTQDRHGLLNDQTSVVVRVCPQERNAEEPSDVDMLANFGHDAEQIKGKVDFRSLCWGSGVSLVLFDCATIGVSFEVQSCPVLGVSTDANGKSASTRGEDSAVVEEFRA